MRSGRGFPESSKKGVLVEDSIKGWWAVVSRVPRPSQYKGVCLLRSKFAGCISGVWADFVLIYPKRDQAANGMPVPTVRFGVRIRVLPSRGHGLDAET